MPNQSFDNRCFKNIYKDEKNTVVQIDFMIEFNCKMLLNFDEKQQQIDNMIEQAVVYIREQLQKISNEPLRSELDGKNKLQN